MLTASVQNGDFHYLSHSTISTVTGDTYFYTRNSCIKEQSTKGCVALLVVCCGNIVSRSARERISGVML